MPKISILIINYNGKGLAASCLKALENQVFKDFEVIIVDNGSLDDSLADIQDYLKKSPISSLVKLVSLGKNTGFTGGNIEGLKYANGGYIALLNNDTEPDKKWLEELVKAMDNNSDIGICASKLIVYGSDIIDSAGDGFSTAFKGFKRGEEENAVLYGKKEYIFGACGGAALYRRSMIDEIGFLDDDFFLIHEDTDLNLRAHLYGWKVLFVPEAKVYHKVRSTIGKMSDTAVYYTLRNSEFVKIKNIPGPLFVRYLPLFVLGMVSEFLYFAVKHMHLIIYIRAKLDVIKKLPLMLKKRKVNMKAMKIDANRLSKIMTPVLEWAFLKNKFKKFISE